MPNLTNVMLSPIAFINSRKNYTEEVLLSSSSHTQTLALFNGTSSNNILH